MTRAYELVCARSDGCLDVVSPSGQREPNRPANDQQNQAPRADGSVDYYALVGVDDVKAMDWRKKLATMLAESVGEKQHRDRQWILKELPDGYTLWEHIRKDTVNDAAPKRQDTYLYGHPQGRRKRFRSPADFFHHLLWLSVDERGDSDNCPCKLCFPDAELAAAEAASGQNKRTATRSAGLTGVGTGLAGSARLASAAVGLATSGGTAASCAPATKAISASAATPSSLPATATQRMTSERTTERDYDRRSFQQGHYIYRPGELVWFNKQQGQQGGAWGLGVIMARKLENDKPHYLLQPLSNPVRHSRPVIKDQEEHLRPWLAWSVPPVTHAQIAGLTFDQVPWQQVVTGVCGPGDAEVDGSILKAKDIDTSYSLFEQIRTPVPAGEVHYTGVFLGAEKIWIDEPVRLRTSGNDIVVMIIKKIILREKPKAPSTTSPNVTFVGDVYKLVQMPSPHSNPNTWPKPDLPPRMLSDLLFRNTYAQAANPPSFYEWRLLEPAAQRGLVDIKGRWYETCALLPVLRGLPQYQADLACGVTTDAGTWMNGRGDSGGALNVRMANRKATVGTAVPGWFKVAKGLSKRVSDREVFPDQQLLDRLVAGQAEELF